MPTLSEAFIKSIASPTTRRRIVFDDHKDAPRGFGLRVTPAGTRSFVLRYRSKEGKDRLLTIGEWGTWSLTAARKEAKKKRQEVDVGLDILEERRNARSEPTLAEVVEHFCRARVDGLQTADAVRAMLSNHLVPALGTKKMTDVRRRDVIALIEDIAKEQNHPRQAGKVLAYVKQVFAFAEDKEVIEGNPVATLKADKISKGLTARKRARVLNDKEIKTLWTRAEESGMHRLTALALKVILITGQRPGEVVGMHWREIEDNIWVIPAERRRKTESAHTVPLTATAIALLEAAKDEVKRLSKRHPRSGGFVFEARPGGPLTINGIDRSVARYAKTLGNRNLETWGTWRPHDLRRTMRTGLSALRTEPIYAELTIGHTRKGISSVYDLHRYDREKYEALTAWEKRLLRIVNGQAAQ